MPIVNLTDLLRHADATSAVPTVTIDDLKEFVAVLKVAETAESPVIISIGLQSFSGIGIETAAAAVERAAAASAIPVALHLDGVSGEQELIDGIRLGFCGVSFAADVSPEQRAELAGIADDCGIAVDRSNGTRQVTSDGSSADLATQIRNLRSGGRAREFLVACRAWTLVEHVVEFNAQGLDEGEVAELLGLGTKVLGSIPGVREIRTGRAAAENARYRYGWFMRFAGPAVIDSFNRHPVHVAFADGHFRPVAQDRLTTNYVLRPRLESGRLAGDN